MRTTTALPVLVLLLAACGGGGTTTVRIPFAPADDTLVILEGGAADLDVLANDGDPAPGPAAVTLLSAPVNGTATVRPGGAVRYAPDPMFNGTDVFSYSATTARRPAPRSST